MNPILRGLGASLLALLMADAAAQARLEIAPEQKIVGTVDTLNLVGVPPQLNIAGQAYALSAYAAIAWADGRRAGLSDIRRGSLLRIELAPPSAGGALPLITRAILLPE